MSSQIYQTKRKKILNFEEKMKKFQTGALFNLLKIFVESSIRNCIGKALKV